MKTRFEENVQTNHTKNAS